MNGLDLQVSTSDERTMVLGFLDGHRRQLRETVLQLSDQQARQSLVSSLTTPMGLLKHAAFVETAWFTCRFGGLTRAEAGIPDTVDESFRLTETDTLAALADTQQEAIERADRVISTLALDDSCHHPAMGKLSARWVLMHCIREFAQHTGHAEILVEQIRSGQRA